MWPPRSVGAMEPEGMTKASTTKARKTKARMKATRMDSMVSLTFSFSWGFSVLTGGAGGGGRAEAGTGRAELPAGPEREGWDSLIGLLSMNELDHCKAGVVAWRDQIHLVFFEELLDFFELEVFLRATADHAIDATGFGEGGDHVVVDD